MRNDPLSIHQPGVLGVFALMAEALAPPPFRPEFRARRTGLDAVVPASAADAVAFEARTAPAAGAAKTSPRKPGLMERLERWFWAQQQRDIEAYLARSADIHDLEERMRNLERGRWHRHD